MSGRTLPGKHKNSYVWETTGRKTQRSTNIKHRIKCLLLCRLIIRLHFDSKKTWRVKSQQFLFFADKKGVCHIFVHIYLQGCSWINKVEESLSPTPPKHTNHLVLVCKCSAEKESCQKHEVDKQSPNIIIIIITFIIVFFFLQ